MNRSVYFCNHCKKALLDVEELLFVEERSARSFCSEDCIEKYYQPIVSWYENLERETRVELKIGDEDCRSLVSDPNLMDKALTRPDEIWRYENEIGEDHFIFIKSFSTERPFHVVIMCHLFERQPSFILLATATRSPALLDKFRGGEKITDPQEFIARDDLPAGAIDFELEQESLNAIEAKKSSFLARLIQDRIAADIPFEQFDLYEKYFKTTLEDPDEIYADEDDEGDQIFNYIKAYQQNGVSFYYFIICIELEKEDDGQEQTRKIIPLLAFPTLDGELYKIYKSGTLVSGSLKN